MGHAMIFTIFSDIFPGGAKLSSSGAIFQNLVKFFRVIQDFVSSGRFLEPGQMFVYGICKFFLSAAKNLEISRIFPVRQEFSIADETYAGGQIFSGVWLDLPGAGYDLSYLERYFFR